MPPLNHFHFSRMCPKCHKINNNHSLEEKSCGLFVVRNNKRYKSILAYK